MAKGFIFSIDAFVAFTFVLVVLHSLIFLAAVPSSYYGGLMQANYLARDTLSALAFTDASKIICDPAQSDYADCVSLYSGVSLSDYVMRHGSDRDVVRAHIGALIPDQYGYRLELWHSDSNSWEKIYDAADYLSDAGETHNRQYHKLMVSSYSLFFGYDSDVVRDYDYRYCYITCNPGNYDSAYAGCATPCDEPVSTYSKGKATLGLARLTVYR